MDESRQIALLRAHEPVLRFNRGERFFPMDVATYVKDASLWVRSPSGSAERVRDAGTLTLQSLGEVRPPQSGATLFLRNAAPMTAAELARHALEDKRTGRKDARDTFRAGRGRLARVGYASRLVDALFSLSLLARGRVPGDLATAAAVAYRKDMQEAPVYRYYGRVTECQDWTVLQYWYFYFFNDWRSHFFGTNDHEGDWESVQIFLGPDGTGDLRPEWIACSCHEYPGSELRRDWNDPEVEKRDGHPVVHVGAGSHAGYYRAGEYLAEVELPMLLPISRLARRIRTFWRDKLFQYSPGESGASSVASDAGPSVLSVPFVDYARGDGHGIGPGEERSWSDPSLITSPPSWVRRYRGLWGYFARDFLSGEDAPPGPRYERDGTIRLSWQDPVTWCGLGSTPPRERVDGIVSRMRDDLEARRGRRQETIDEIRRELLAVGVGGLVSGGTDGAGARELRQREEELSARLTAELRQLGADDDTLEALEDVPPRVGTDLGRRSHLQKPLQPIPGDRLRARWIAEVWSALSVGVLLLALAFLAVFARERLVTGAVVLLSWVVVIEAFLRNRLTRLVTAVAVSLALICTLVLLVEFHRPLAIAVAVGTALFLLWENLRELWS